MDLIKKTYRLLSPSERRGALLLLFLMVIGMAFEMVGIGIVIPILGVLMSPDIVASYPQTQPWIEWFGNPSQEEIIVAAMASLAGVWLVKTLYLGFLAWWQARFVYGVLATLSQRLFEHYMMQPYVFHLQRNSSELVRNVYNEVGTFCNNCLRPMALVVAELLVLLGVLLLLLIVEPRATLLVAAFLLLSSWSFHRVTKSALKHWGQFRLLSDGKRMQAIQQGLGGVKDVKLLGREKDFLAEYRLHCLGSAKMNELYEAVNQLPRLWLELLGILALTSLVTVLLKQGQSAEEIVPMLGLWAAAAFRIMPSANRILMSLQTIKYGVASLSSLNHEMSGDETYATNFIEKSKLIFTRSISIRSLDFSYANTDKQALKNVSFEITKGTSIGIIGPSGSGKSTLIDLVLGLLAPQSGEILVDGFNINSCLRDWQNLLGYVPQSIYLTDDSLSRNVAFGIPLNQIDHDAVEKALRAAQMWEFVSGLPKGLDTFVGERGVRLSGGQRQRIGIARALYHDPEVLVLDEATSALDGSTEKGVMAAVSALHGSKTVLIVAHRLSTVEQCDRIYRLERGKIVWKGLFSEVESP